MSTNRAKHRRSAEVGPQMSIEFHEMRAAVEIDLLVRCYTDSGMSRRQHLRVLRLSAVVVREGGRQVVALLVETARGGCCNPLRVAVAGETPTAGCVGRHAAPVFHRTRRTARRPVILGRKAA